MVIWKILAALVATGWGCIVFAQAWPTWAWLLFWTAYATLLVAGLVVIIAWLKVSICLRKGVLFGRNIAEQGRGGFRV